MQKAFSDHRQEGFKTHSKSVSLSSIKKEIAYLVDGHKATQHINLIQNWPGLKVTQRVKEDDPLLVTPHGSMMLEHRCTAMVEAYFDLDGGLLRIQVDLTPFGFHDPVFRIVGLPFVHEPVTHESYGGIDVEYRSSRPAFHDRVNLNRSGCSVVGETQEQVRMESLIATTKLAQHVVEELDQLIHVPHDAPDVHQLLGRLRS